MPAWAMEVLSELVENWNGDPHAPVFPSRSNTWRSPHNVRRQWREVRGEEFAWVTPHTFRKTVATLVDEEHDSDTASKVLGHSSDRVTKEHYIESAELAPDVRDLLDKLAPETQDGDDE